MSCMIWLQGHEWSNRGYCARAWFSRKSLPQGLVVSIFIVGAFFGSLGSSALVDKFGCKRTLQIDSIPLIIGALLRYLVSLLQCFC